jgi:hypothetical protein
VGGDHSSAVFERNVFSTPVRVGAEDIAIDSSTTGGLRPRMSVAITYKKSYQEKFN